MADLEASRCWERARKASISLSSGQALHYFHTVDYRNFPGDCYSRRSTMTPTGTSLNFPGDDGEMVEVAEAVVGEENRDVVS